MSFTLSYRALSLSVEEKFFDSSSNGVCGCGTAGQRRGRIPQLKTKGSDCSVARVKKIKSRHSPRWAKIKKAPKLSNKMSANRRLFYIYMQKSDFCTGYVYATSVSRESLSRFRMKANRLTIRQYKSHHCTKSAEVRLLHKLCICHECFA